MSPRRKAGLAARLQGARVIICAGSGGVGKTTTSAAIAMGLAARGARVAVVTIDPARRLADALGLDELGNDPALVDPERFAKSGVERFPFTKRGSSSPFCPSVKEMRKE